MPLPWNRAEGELTTTSAANFTPYHETLWSETKGKSILVLATLLKNVVSHDSSPSTYNRGKKSDIPRQHCMTNFILSNWLNYTLIAFRGKPYQQTLCVPFKDQYNKKAALSVIFKLFSFFASWYYFCLNNFWMCFHYWGPTFFAIYLGKIVVLMIIVTTIMIMSMPHRDFPHVFPYLLREGKSKTLRGGGFHSFWCHEKK